MFGIGPQELIIIGFLALIVLGPSKLPSTAKDFGRFISGANRTVEGFKDDLLTEDLEEVRSSVKNLKSEIKSN